MLRFLKSNNKYQYNKLRIKMNKVSTLFILIMYNYYFVLVNQLLKTVWENVRKASGLI